MAAIIGSVPYVFVSFRKTIREINHASAKIERWPLIARQTMDFEESHEK
jgi:hypothetical protein